MIAAVTLLTACAAPQLTTLGPDEVIPRSASIRSGTLANGLRYFIEPDVATPKRAEVWLVVEAGSLYEDADQRGAALLIERLAWQGTRRFSRKAIRRFLRNAGMREDDDFGSQTSYDRMLFKLQVPSDDIVAVAEAFQLMRGWMTDIRFDQTLLKSQRNLIAEEWRNELQEHERLGDPLRAIQLAGSQYVKRWPRPAPEALARLSRASLLRYVRDWFRPERMAIIVVGDVNVRAIETRIETVFGSVSAIGSARPAPIVTLPPQTAPRVAPIVAATFAQTGVVWSAVMPHRSPRRIRDYRLQLAESLCREVIGERLRALAHSPNPPFAKAKIEWERVSNTLDVVVMVAVVSNAGVAATTKALGDTMAQVERQEISATELKRARERVDARIRRSFAGRHYRSWLGSRAHEIARHSLDGEFVTTTEQERALGVKLLAEIAPAEVSAAAARWRREGVGPSAKENPISENIEEISSIT